MDWKCALELDPFYSTSFADIIFQDDDVGHACSGYDVVFLIRTFTDNKRTSTRKTVKNSFGFPDCGQVRENP